MSRSPGVRARRRHELWADAKQSGDRGADGKSITEAGATEAIRRTLAASVLDDPTRIADALSHRINGTFEVEPHGHTDLLQLDVIYGCVGEASQEDRVTQISGTTLMATMPGVRHGYQLEPSSDQAAVWLVKLRVGRPPGGALSPLPPLLTGLASANGLRAAMADFVGDWTPQGVGLGALARLVTALCLWPVSVLDTEPLEGPGSLGGHVAAFGGEGPSARVRRAIQTLGQRLTDPPSLDELSEAAGLSSRHFARRFRQDFGCTPHAWLAARRLDAARGRLRDPDLQVAEVAADLGFSSPAAFSRWFTRLAGQSPRAFRDDPHGY